MRFLTFAYCYSLLFDRSLKSAKAFLVIAPSYYCRPVEHCYIYHFRSWFSFSVSFSLDQNWTDWMNWMKILYIKKLHDKNVVKHVTLISLTFSTQLNSDPKLIINHDWCCIDQIYHLSKWIVANVTSTRDMKALARFLNALRTLIYIIAMTSYDNYTVDGNRMRKKVPFTSPFEWGIDMKWTGLSNFYKRGRSLTVEINVKWMIKLDS